MVAISLTEKIVSDLEGKRCKTQEQAYNRASFLRLFTFLTKGKFFYQVF